MSDVLTLTVPIDGRYPSVNHIGADGHRGGKKSAMYHALFHAVKTAAELEIERTGWQTAACDCLAVIVRYVEDRRRHDAMNLAKCEFDALTKAGVWADDALANPPMPWVRFDAPHRITIAVVKLHQPVTKAVPVAVEQPSSAPGVRTSRRVEAGTNAAPPDWRPGDVIPRGYVVLNGKLVTFDFAREKGWV